MMTPASTDPGSLDLDSVAQSLSAERTALAAVLAQVRAARAEAHALGSIPEWRGIAALAFASRSAYLDGVLVQASDALERAIAGAGRAIGTLATASGEK